MVPTGVPMLFSMAVSHWLSRHGRARAEGPVESYVASAGLNRVAELVPSQ